MRFCTHLIALLALLASLCLTACGGGGSDEEEDPPKGNPPVNCQATPKACV